MTITKLLPHDKCLHIIAGVLIFALLHFFGNGIAIGAVITIALAKEVGDYFTPDATCDWVDAVATVAGGLLGLVCTL